MSRTTLTRWGIATVGFVLIALAEIRFGHAVALVTLLALMLIVAIYGGSGYGDGGVPSGRGAAPESGDDRTGISDRSKPAGAARNPVDTARGPGGASGSSSASGSDLDAGGGR